MKIFASELSKCRVWKAVYGWMAVILAFIVFIIMPAVYILTAPIEKTEEDFVKEYILLRMNFTPNNTDIAYHNPLQYKFPLYETVIKDEVSYIKDRQIYQLFSLVSLMKGQDGDFVAKGRLVKFSCLSACEKVYENFVNVIISEPRPYKFVVKEIRE